MGSGKIAGKVAEVGPSGDLITDITLEQLDVIPAGADVTVRCEEHQTVGILPADHGEPEMTLVAVRGPQGVLEIRLVGESAQRFLGLRAGDPVVVRW